MHSEHNCAFAEGYTVEPLIKSTFGTSCLVHYRDVVFFQRLFSIECVYDTVVS